MLLTAELLDVVKSTNLTPLSLLLYRMSQEEKSTFWETIVLVILRKKVYMNMLLSNGRKQACMSHCSLLKAVRPEQPTPVVIHFLLKRDVLPKVAGAPAAPARKPPVDSSSGSGGIPTSSPLRWLVVTVITRQTLPLLPP
jgi:hypothetical protein